MPQNKIGELKSIEEHTFKGAKKHIGQWMSGPVKNHYKASERLERDLKWSFVVVPNGVREPRTL